MRTFTPSLFQQSVTIFLIVQIVFTSLTPQTAMAGPGVVTSVSVTNTFDPNGNLVTRTDANGAITTFTYDVRNRLVGIDYPGGNAPDVSFTYDQNSNRSSMTDSTGTTSYYYDTYDRLTEIDYPNGNFVVYGYDSVNNVTDLQFGNWKVLSTQGKYSYLKYTYDADNRISTVKNVSTGDTTSYSYNAAGQISKRTLPNGVYSDYSYDGDGRFTNIVHRTSNNALICQYGYILNAIGNRIQMTETTTNAVRTTSYTYDPLDRLKTVTYPDGRFVSYSFDSIGNRTNVTEIADGTTNVTAYFCDSDSRLLATTVNGATNELFYYDSAGNLLQRVRATDNRVINYSYDFENRLVRYYDGTNNVEYRLNGIGERVAKISNGKSVSFINNPQKAAVELLAELDSTDMVDRIYERGNELINQENANGSNRFYYLCDGLNGNVRGLINQTGIVTNTYDYDAFGSLTSAIEPVKNSFRYRCEFQEADTGLVYLRTRCYIPEIGRFASKDPLGPTTGINVFAYCKNDPINLIDPLGLSTSTSGQGCLGDEIAACLGVEANGDKLTFNFFAGGGVGGSLSGTITHDNEPAPVAKSFAVSASNFAFNYIGQISDGESSLGIDAAISRQSASKWELQSAGIKKA